VAVVRILDQLDEDAARALRVDERDRVTAAARAWHLVHQRDTLLEIVQGHDHIGIDRSEALYLTEAPDGSYRLTPNDPNFQQKMSAVEDIAARYRNTLHVLAK
jgi:hypothetical protein